MTAYTRTWDTDAPGYNALTERALEQIEAQAAKIWDVISNSTWGDHGPSGANDRILATTYTNTSGIPKFVMVSMNVHAISSPTVASTATATAIINPATDNYTVGKVSQTAPIGVSRTTTSPLMFVVSNGESYRVNSTVTASGTVTIQYWYEYAFDAKYTAQTYTQGEQPTATKFNTYANAINNSSKRNSPFAHVSASPSVGNTRTNPNTESTFVVTNVQLASSPMQDATATLGQLNSGGSLTSIAMGKAETNSTNRRSFAFIVNGSGGYRVSQTVATVSFVDTFEMQMVRPYSRTFTDNDSGDTSKNKWHALDRNGYVATNPTVTYARVNAGTAATARTPSASAFTLVAASVLLSPSAVTAAVVTLDVNGAAVARVQQAAAGDAAHVMLFAVIPKGQTWAISGTGTFTIEQRTEWLAELIGSTVTTDLPRLLGGEVGVWQMDSDDHGQPSSGLTRDSSGNGRNLTITGATNVAGKFGNGYDFSGTNQYLRSTDAALHLTGDMTLLVWVNPDALPTSGAAELGNQNNGENAYACMITTTGAIRYQHTNGAGVADFTSTGTITTGSWQLVGFIRDTTAKTVRIIVNGTIESAVSYTPTVGSGGLSSIFTHGADRNADSDYNGKSDELRIYNRKLVEAEVTSIMNYPYDYTPLASWHMDSYDNDKPSAGQTLDSSGNGLHLTKNSVTVVAGKFGDGYDFSGTNQSLSNTTSTSLDITGDMTFLVWVNPDTVGGSYYQLLDMFNTTTAYSLRFETNQKLRYLHSTTSQPNTQLDSTATIATGSWQLIGFIRDTTAKTIQLIVNGVIESAQSYTHNPSSAGGAGFRLGIDSANNNDFDGKMDDARIYKRKLSAAEVASIADDPYSMD